ncbi:MAG TPA: AraC family transcriptional regulator [Polyangiaceae bacterium]|jgi:AraC-like DNA-binding protein|nr:AraC family transcriptional regulator [Polyangiaceae bacterium]
MAMGSVEPWTNVLRLDESSSLRTHCYSDRFSIVRVETTGPLPDAVHKSSNVPALLVSTFVRPVAAPDYRLWVDGKIIPMGAIPAFSVNVVDLAAEPAMWGGRGVDYVHFHVRRGTIDETAATLGYERIGDIRLSVAQEDIVLAQLTRSVLPFLGSGAPPPLVLDQLELILAAHVIQRYGSARRARAAVRGGLAAWQRRQVTEMLRDNLDGRTRLATLAQTCNLSVSHFARAFKASFGVACHRWLTERRIERAQELLAATRMPLAEVASRSGFADQAAFTRVFRRIVGVPPGLWRRENAKWASR